MKNLKTRILKSRSPLPKNSNSGLFNIYPMISLFCKEILIVTHIPSLICLLCPICLLLFICLLSPKTVQAELEVARLVSIEGKVEALTTGEQVWHTARIEEGFGPGDRLRIGPYGRAAIVLSNNTVIRLEAQTTITFTKSDEEGFWLELLKGAAYFLSRVTRTLKATTPFVNAFVEGTEFLLKVDEHKTILTVFEGRVLAYNDFGELSISSHQSAIARKNEAPAIYMVVRPHEAVQWALYYPPVLQFGPQDFSEKPEMIWQSKVAQSIKFYQQGRLAEALAIIDDVSDDTIDTRFFTYRASLKLSLGRIPGSRADLDRALSLAPENGEALALKSIMAVVNNEKEQALELAKQAVAKSPGKAGPLLALSYAWQARFELHEARASLEKAIALAPQNPLAWSRLAELRLMFRDLNGALEAAQRAVDMNPKVAMTQTVLGYAQLIYLNIEKARQIFIKAISLDQAAPLARLGLGLALIQAGNLEEGRCQIEIAVALDPANALIRSYLGKAYYEEKRDALANSQYALAKSLDPFDPTPYFYGAILKQASNQPVAALEDIQRAIQLNNNRAVYRSRLLLDEDLASRGASLARIYNDLGYEQLGLIEGWKSLNTDPGNYSAHRLLADSYIQLPLHEISRVSELLQSQLLQPLNIDPVSPQLAETNLMVIDRGGPGRAAYNEFNQLYLRDRLALQFNNNFGNHETRGNELVLAFQEKGLSFDLGQFHYETEGFRENDDLKQDIYNGFSQFCVSQNLSLQFEVRHQEVDNGDILLLFDSNSSRPYFRQAIDQDAWRIGINYRPNSSQILILSFINDDKTDNQSDILTYPEEPNKERHDFLLTQRDGSQIEMQHLYLGEALKKFTGKPIKTVTGFGYADLDNQDLVYVDGFRDNILVKTVILADSKSPVTHQNAYLYTYLPLSARINAILGLSYDHLEKGDWRREQFNPKFGLIWNPTLNTTLRAAAFRTMRCPILNSQTIEPTQVAGFNQFFDNTDGADAWRYGLGFDQRLTPLVYYGIEATQREVKKYIKTGDTRQREKQDEQFHQAYIYWSPTRNLGFSAEYQFEDFEREYISGDINPIKPAGVTTQLIPFQLRFFFSNGLFGNLQTQHVDQDIKLVADQGLDKKGDHFWVTDIAIGYRFPKRMGLVTLGISNVFDEKFSFQSTHFETGTPRLPRFQPAQGIYGKLNLLF